MQFGGLPPWGSLGTYFFWSHLTLEVGGGNKKTRRGEQQDCVQGHQGAGEFASSHPATVATGPEREFPNMGRKRPPFGLESKGTQEGKSAV